MKNKSLVYATVLALTTAVISGASNFINKFAVSGVKDPVFYTTLKNAVVALLLLAVIIGIRKWAEIRKLSRAQWWKLIAIGAVGGSLPFALYFIGLSRIPAINASLIHKTLFLWVFILAIPILKEKVTRLQVLGIAAIFAANVMVGGFQGFKFSSGEFLVLCATVLWAVENIIAKKVLVSVSSSVVAGMRMFFGTLLLLPLVFFRDASLASVTAMSFNQWGWVLLASLLLLGYVLTWYEALKYAPATYVATLLVPATLVTNVLSAVFITHTFNWQFLVSSGLFVTGVVFMIWEAKKLKGDFLPAETAKV